MITRDYLCVIYIYIYICIYYVLCVYNTSLSLSIYIYIYVFVAPRNPIREIMDNIAGKDLGGTRTPVLQTNGSQTDVLRVELPEELPVRWRTFTPLK